MRNRVSVELITGARILRKRVAKPNFYRDNRIAGRLTVVQCKVATLTLNRPIYVGFSVLELPKLHMCDFHYNHMCVKYPSADQLRLLFTDTDSLAYAVQTDGIYRDMLMMLRLDMTLASILSTILFMIHIIAKMN